MQQLSSWFQALSQVASAYVTVFFAAVLAHKIALQVTHNSGVSGDRRNLPNVSSLWGFTNNSLKSKFNEFINLLFKLNEIQRHVTTFISWESCWKRPPIDLQSTSNDEKSSAILFSRFVLNMNVGRWLLIVNLLLVLFNQSFDWFANGCWFRIVTSGYLLFFEYFRLFLNI